MKTATRCVCLVLGSLVMAGCRGCEKQPTKPRDQPPNKAPAPNTHTPDLDSLSEVLARARRGRAVRFVAPTEQEEQAHSAWTENVVRAALASRLPTAAPPDGFAGLLADHGRLWLLGEEPDRKRGSGALVLDPSSNVRILVEAPHTFFDRNTLEIAIQTFQTLGARALLVNTIHRGSGTSEEDRTDASLSGTSPADVAHADHSFFLSCHKVLVRTDPALTTLQLHGFRDDAAPGVDVIVSASRTRADPKVLADALRNVLEPSRVRAYPSEIRTLGGTKNVEAAASRSHNSRVFHLEISASLRTRLKEDASLGERFAKALGDGVRRN